MNSFTAEVVMFIQNYQGNNSTIDIKLNNISKNELRKIIAKYFYTLADYILSYLNSSDRERIDRRDIKIKYKNKIFNVMGYDE
jgi:hypothetical protein